MAIFNQKLSSFVMKSSPCCSTIVEWLLRMNLQLSKITNFNCVEAAFSSVGSYAFQLSRTVNRDIIPLFTTAISTINKMIDLFSLNDVKVA